MAGAAETCNVFRLEISCSQNADLVKGEEFCLENTNVV